MKTQTKTEQILMVMSILAWVAFVGYMIEAGAILYSYVESWSIPEAAQNLYRGLNLYNLKQFNFWYYTLSVSFMVALSIMKSYVSFLVVKTLSKFKLKEPFSLEVARNLEKISHVAFGTWLITMLSNANIAWLMKITGELHGNYISGEFIFMVAIVFIISQVFLRGAEIQKENELTV